MDGFSDDERVKYLVDGVSFYNYACESPQDGRFSLTLCFNEHIKLCIITEGLICLMKFIMLAGRKTQTWEDTLESWRNVGFSDTDKDNICTVSHQPHIRDIC